MVTSGGERFVIPQASLLELIRLEGESGERQIEYIHGTPVYRRRGSLLPMVYLSDVLGFRRPPDSGVVNIVVLQAEDRQFGLVVDGIKDTQEIVVKPLGKQLKGLNCYAGATIMGDGRVALILDVLGIGQLSGVLAESREQTRAEPSRGRKRRRRPQTLPAVPRRIRSSAWRCPLSLVARLEEFRAAPTSSTPADSRWCNTAAGSCRCVSLRVDPRTGVPDRPPARDPVQVIVFNDGERSMGILVDQILDIVEDTSPSARQPAARACWARR